MWGIPANSPFGELPTETTPYAPQLPFSAPSYYSNAWDDFSYNQQQRNDLSRTPDWAQWLNPTGWQNPTPIERNVIYPALNAVWYPFGTALDASNQFIAKPVAGLYAQGVQAERPYPKFNESQLPQVREPQSFNQIMSNYPTIPEPVRTAAEIGLDPTTWMVGGATKKAAADTASDLWARARATFPEEEGSLLAQLMDETGAVGRNVAANRRANIGQLRRLGATGRLPNQTLNVAPTSAPPVSLRPQNPSTWIGAKLSQLGEWLEKELADRFARLSKIGTRAVKTTKEVARATGYDYLTAGKYGESKLEEAGSLWLGATGAAKMRINTALRDVNRILGKDAQIVDEVFNRFWVFKHLQEIKRYKPRFKIEIEGVQYNTPVDFANVLNGIKAQVGDAAYGKLDTAVRRLSSELSDLFVRSEGLKASDKQKILSMYKYYHPLVQAVDQDITSFFKRPASFVKSMGEELLEIKQPFDIFAGTVNSRVRNLARNNLVSALAKAIQFDPKYRDFVEITTGKATGRVLKFYENGIERNLIFKEGAEQVYKDTVDYLGEGARTTPGRFMTAVAWLQNVSRLGYTTLSPVFIARNLMVDSLTLWMREGIGPKSYIPALIEELSNFFVEGKNIQAMARAGAEIGSTWTQKMATGTPAKIINGTNQWRKFLNPLEVIKYVGSAIEETPRLATYKKYVKAGETAEYAAMQARRVTVDFDRFSLLTKDLNTLYLFLNAGKEGFLLPFRNLRDRPREAIPKIVTLMGAVAGLSMWNNQFKGYQEISLSDRINSLIIYVRDDVDNQGRIKPVYIKIMPILREWSMYTAPIVYTIDALYRQNPKDAEEFIAYLSGKRGQFDTGEFAKTWVAGWNPASQFAGTGGLALPTQVGRVAEQWARNRDDYHNRPIVPPELESKPNAEQYDETTSGTAIALGRLIDQSPMKIDFAIQGVVGTSGRELTSAIDLAVNQYIKENNDPEIAGHVLALKKIAESKNPNQIQIARKEYLGGLQPDTKEQVLDAERVPVDRIPYLSGIVSAFYREGPGGQSFKSARSFALEQQGKVAGIEPLDTVRASALANAKSIVTDSQYTKEDYDKSRTKYMSYYSGSSSQNWNQLQQRGYVSTSDVNQYLPEDKLGPKELQASDAYRSVFEIILAKKPSPTSEDYDNAELMTYRQLARTYGEVAAKYAVAHKDDFINNLPPESQAVERQRLKMIEDGTWWKDYRKPGAFGRLYSPSPTTPLMQSQPTQLRGVVDPFQIKYKKYNQK